MFGPETFTDLCSFSPSFEFLLSLIASCLSNLSSPVIICNAESSLKLRYIYQKKKNLLHWREFSVCFS